MKPTVTIFVCVLAAGLALAQSPSMIQNTRNSTNMVSNHATAASNEALGVHAPAPAAASQRRVGVVTPMKSSPAAPRSEGAKHRGTRKRIWAVGVVGSSPAASSAEAPQNDSPAGDVVAGNGTSGSGEGESEQQVAPNSKYNANGRRDPFISPVVSHAGGSGCSTGKKCLEIGAINLRGVVRAENGFIAVVSNGLNKAYFLRENDPVFNGYVMKITGDSIVFQETLQDRMGKTFTRKVVKKITTPAV